MSRSFKLPDLGEGIHEGEVLAVPVTVGQEVNEGDIILEVETDKAAVEIPSPFIGSVQEIFVKPGDIVNVGDVMMTFSGGEEAEEVEEKKQTEGPAPPAEALAAVPPSAARTQTPGLSCRRYLCRSPPEYIRPPRQSALRRCRTVRSG